MDWIAKNIARIALVAIAVAVIAALLWLNSCQTARVAATDARLSNGMAGSAIGAAIDAGNTAAAAQAEQSNNQAIVKDTNDALKNASTAAAAGDAGRDGLRRLDRRSR